MKHNQINKIMSILCIIISCFFYASVTAHAASQLDPAYYATTYPDVVGVLGKEPQALYNHYITYGMREGRLPYAGAQPGIAVDGILGYTIIDENTVVKKLPQFDPEFYAMNYPVTYMVYGGDPEGMYINYIVFGRQEGRIPYEGAQPGEEVSGIKGYTDVNQTFEPVPMNQLANLSSLRKNLTDEELAQAYNIAVEVVRPFAGLSRENQLYGVMMSLMINFGEIYSMQDAHYNDPYGYFVLQTASCAGCTRATGLCLNILGIPYEHVNENQYKHQWCRVDIDGTYWICDEFGIYSGPEPAPYEHPYFTY